MVLVASETVRGLDLLCLVLSLRGVCFQGHVYTYATGKLQPVFARVETQNLIRQCLCASAISPHNNCQEPPAEERKPETMQVTDEASRISSPELTLADGESQQLVVKLAFEPLKHEELVYSNAKGKETGVVVQTHDAAVDTKEAEVSAGETKNIDRSRYWDSKWDSVLEELHKMGFEDADKNKWLVSANFGELKSVVKCLITDERSNAVRDQHKRMHEAQAPVPMDLCPQDETPVAETDTFQCPQCKANRSVYFQKQTRCANEPMKVFIKCQECGHNWKEY